MKKSVQGFTLIELLVAITIVAILSLIGLTLYNSSQSVARDAKRREDIDAIAAALEQRFDPSTNQYSALDGTAFQGSAFPQDPINKTPYQYTNNGAVIPSSGTAAVSSYVICAQLENKNGNSKDNTTAANDSGSNALYYCKVNRQGGTP